MVCVIFEFMAFDEIFPVLNNHGFQFEIESSFSRRPKNCVVRDSILVDCSDC